MFQRQLLCLWSPPETTSLCPGDNVFLPETTSLCPGDNFFVPLAPQRQLGRFDACQASEHPKRRYDALRDEGGEVRAVSMVGPGRGGMLGHGTSRV